MNEDLTQRIQKFTDRGWRVETVSIAENRYHAISPNGGVYSSRILLAGNGHDGFGNHFSDNKLIQESSEAYALLSLVQDAAWQGVEF